MDFLKSDTWLSKRIKKKTFFLDEKNILSFLRKKKLNKNYFIFSKTKNKKFSKLLKENNFRYITTNFQCAKKIINVKNSDINCVVAKKKDMQAVKKISKNSYRYSRFHLDKKIPKKICDEIFIKWVESYFKKKRGDFILLYKIKNKVIGFLLLKIEKFFSLRIDLIAVDNKFKRLGISKKLINYAMFLYYKKFNYLTVGFHSHNKIAKKFYSKIGFKLKSTKEIYHYYFKN